MWQTSEQFTYNSNGQVTLKAPVSAWSPKCNDKPVQYLDGWPLK